MAQQIIKRSAAEDLFAPGTTFHFGTIEDRAKGIIDEARSQAEEMIRRAKLEVDQMRAEIRGEEFEAARKDGFDKGYQEGFSQGLEKGKTGAFEARTKQLNEQLGELPDVVRKLAQEVESRRARMTEESERDLLALSFAIAERFTRGKVEVSPDTVHNAVRECIELVLNRATLDIYVAPQDLHAVRDFMPALHKEFTDAGAIEVHADPQLTRGSVIVKTGRGRVTSDLSAQIDGIARLLLGTPPAEALARMGIAADAPPPVTGSADKSTKTRRRRETDTAAQA